MPNFQQGDAPMMSVSGSDDSAKYMKDMIDGLAEISLFTEKLGNDFEKVGGNIGTMVKQNEAMLMSLQAYTLIMQTLNQGTTELLQSNRQLSIEFSNQNTQQDMFLSKEEQRLAMAQKRIQAEDEAAKKKYSEEVGKTAGAIKNPLSAGMNAISNIVPELAIIEAIAAVAKSSFDAYRGYEKMASSGGTDISGMGGMGGIGKFNMESRINTFMGYGTEAESQGAMISLMKAGLRGDELADAFDGLGKAAEEAGMKMQDYAATVGLLTRRYNEGTGSSATAAKEGIDSASRIAEANKFDKEGFIKSVVEVSANNRAYFESNPEMKRVIKEAGPGQDPLETIMITVAQQLKAYQNEVYKGNITQEQYNKTIGDGVRQNKSWGDIMEEMASVQNIANRAGEKTGVVMEYRNKLEEQYLPYATNRLEAEKEATITLKSGFVEGLKEGKYSLETLNAVLPDLQSKFGKQGDSITDFSMKYDKMGKELGIDGKQIATNVTTMAKDLIPIIKDPAVALATSEALMTESIAKLMNTNQLSVGQSTAFMKTSIDVMGDSATEAKNRLLNLAKTVDGTDMRLGEMIDFLNSSAQALRKFGISEDAAAHTRSEFNKYLHDGSISLQSFNELLKGPAGASEGVKAMAYESAMGKGGMAGALAKESGNVFGFDVALGDLNDVISGKKAPTKALESFKSKMGGGKGFYSDLQKQVLGEISGTMGDVVEGAGFGGDSFGARGLQSKLAPSLGFNIEAYGKAQEKAMNTLFEHGKNFGDSVKVMATAADNLKKASEGNSLGKPKGELKGK